MTNLRQRGREKGREQEFTGHTFWPNTLLSLSSPMTIARNQWVSESPSYIHGKGLPVSDQVESIEGMKSRHTWVNHNNCTFVQLIKTPLVTSKAHREGDIAFLLYTLKSARSLDPGAENTQGPNQQIIKKVYNRVDKILGNVKTLSSMAS